MLYSIRRTLEDVALSAKGFAEIRGITLPTRHVSAEMRRAMADGIYERNELDIVERTLEPDDRVLECGAGIGLLSTFCAKRVGSDRVKTFEANPFMASIIAKTYELNRVFPKLVIGAIGAAHDQIDFHVRKNFWPSSSHVDRAQGARTITVPCCALNAEILATRPTYLCIDIEGAEEHLVGCSDLDGVLRVMVEVHPELIGESAVDRFIGWLNSLGFTKNDSISKERELFFVR